MADRGGGRRGRGNKDRGDGRGRGGRGGAGPGPAEGRGGDRGGRGQGRGRGGDRGDRGDRGGRGFDGPRGGRGGRGDRGDFRGGFSGHRGEYRGDYRGRGRGDRGRGGRRDEDPGKGFAFSIDGSVPSPDLAVTKLEDERMQAQSSSVSQLSSGMKKLDVGDKGGTDQFPLRPAFGNNGRAVVLWTNYFQLHVKPVTFYKYTLEAVQVGTVYKGPETPGQKPEGKQKNGEVKGRKLHLAFQQALTQLIVGDEALVLASEFKSQLITLKKLDLAQTPIKVYVPVESKPGVADVIKITFDGPAEAPVEGLLRYLKSMEDGPGDHTFPRYPDVVSALNVVLGHRPRSQLDKISALSSAAFLPFGPGEKIQNLFSSFHALVAVRGAFQSARLGTGRILLNTNVIHRVFKPSGRLHELMASMNIRAVPIGDVRGMRNLKAFAKFLPKTRVWVDFTLHDGTKVRRTKAIHNLAASWDFRRNNDHPPKFQQDYVYGGPKNISFWLGEKGGGRYITVYEHFKQKYGMDLGPYPVINVGTAAKPVFFPAEVVEIQPGQPAMVKLTGDETTTMLDFACRSPFANAVTVTTDCRQTLGLDEDSELGKYGINVDKKLLTVHGRVLDAPMVTYIKMDGRQRADVVPKNGSWNMRNVKVAKPGAMIERWSWVNVLNGRRPRPVEADVVMDFVGFMNNMMGIRIHKSPVPPPEEIMSPDYDQIQDRFEWAKENHIQFLFFILSEKDTEGLYNQIKTLGDCNYGIHTSCVVGDKFGKGSPGYFANVGLKWNLKAGGVNHKLRDEFGILKDGKTMLAGYDVTHPTNMNVKKGNEPPSLVGLVASIDRDLGQWPAAAWEQAAKKEMLGDTLVAAFRSRLELWEKHNKGALPENIVIFRDGVSEGQYAQVLDQELPFIRDACRQKYKAKNQPKLTIVVSVKRHQTRFYPTDKNDMSASGNIPSGTVVDRGITQVRYWDFFLTAHDAIKGTARPAHYTVLLDEVFRTRHRDQAANQLERLTHELCYLFGRATRAVSICPPAYYADMVCERARAHRPEYYDVSDVESVVTGAGPGSSVGVGGRQIHEALRDTMYYV